ncbi:MAG: gamma carbonic anhydrase family protein [Mangrovibacterium sp.]
MAIIRPLNGKTPQIGKKCFIAENAAIIGDVEIGNGSSVWYSTVMRGDVNYIKVGENTSIQDCAVIHGTYEKSPTNIGSHVIIAHGAIVHGATLHDHVMVGMNAVVLDNCVVHSNTIIAAGSVVTKGTVVEGNSVYAGIPAKKIKDLTPELAKNELERIATNYATYASWYDDYYSEAVF